MLQKVLRLIKTRSGLSINELIDSTSRGEQTPSHISVSQSSQIFVETIKMYINTKSLFLKLPTKYKIICHMQ